MCVVYDVSDYGQRQWPEPKIPSKKEVEEFYDLLKKAREIDIKTGQPDCPSPEKTEWLNRFKELVRELYGHIENEPV